MPFNRPTLTALVDRARDDIDARLPGADSRLRRSVLDVLARIHAAATSGLYGFLDWIWRQIFPDTAEAEQLARWAAIWGIARKAAVPAAGNIGLVGVNGSIVPLDTALLRSDGAEYRTTAVATIAGGVAVVAVAASEPGLAGNAAAAQKLTFASPVAGVNAIATVAGGGLAAGADEEDDDSLRARLLTRIRRPPHGGNAADYERWALEVAGVTRAWVYPLQLGPGTVSIAFVMDGREDIIPTGPDVDLVAAHIDEVRPVTADVTVFAPIAAPLDFLIHAVPPSPAVQAAIDAELTDLLARESSPGGTLLISHMREAISIAAGELDHTLVAPAANVVSDPGEIAVMGDITWVP
jgi:uncharacterized phage protein gp47/JayE